MASGPFAEVLTEAESKELIAIDQHIRSLSTLGYILRVNSTFPTLPRENNEAVKTNNVVGMLENLAQCLVRERLENASVGIVAEGQILAGELSISRRDDDVPKGEALVKELSFDQLHSATNTEKGTTSRSGVGSLAGAEFHKIKNQAQQLMDLITKSLKEGEGLDYKWPTISKLVYQYRSHSAKTKRPSYPSFHLHAVVSFDFLKCVLQDWPEDGKDASELEAARCRSFIIFVTGMSFAKLGYRLQDPPTSSSTKSVTEYLTKPLFPQDFTDVKNASVKDKELAPLIGYFKYMWTMVMPQQEQATNSDMKHAIDQLSSNGKFTTLIAAACHLMLRTLFQNLCAQYKRLDSLEPSELEHADDGNDGSRIFEEHLPDIVFALEVLNFFAHSDLLKHLMRSTNVAPSTPGTPKHQQSRRDIKTEDNEFGSSTFPSPVTPPQHQEEGEDDDFDGLDWQDTFVNWLKRLVRQYASAQHLTLLKDTWRSRISHLNMGIVLEPKPNNKMQPWRAAIREIAQSDSKRLRQCMMTMGYLVTIEQNVRDNMDSIRRLWAPLVKPMDGRKWEDCFWGTIHGEAAVAAVYAQNQQPRRLPFYGVSKHCCPCCAILIEIVAGKRGFSSSANLTFLGRSHKWWRWALPPRCPLDVARKVSKALDTAIYLVLQETSDELERISKLVRSGSSHDENSRGNCKGYEGWSGILPTPQPVFDPEGKIRNQN